MCAGLDVYCSHRPAALSIKMFANAAPLIDWAMGRRRKANICEISKCLPGSAEFKQLADRIQTQDPPAGLGRMTVPPRVRYVGRWMRGRTPCLSMSRMEVSNSGEVRCCPYGERIGNVGESHAVMQQRLDQITKAAEERRGCAECPNVECPRCPFPGVDDSTYCQIMNKHKSALRSLEQIWLYSRLPLLLALQRVS